MSSDGRATKARAKNDTKNSGTENPEEKGIREMLHDINRKIMTLPMKDDIKSIDRSIREDIRKMDRSIRQEVGRNSASIMDLDKRFTQHQEEVPALIRSEVERVVVCEKKKEEESGFNKENYLPVSYTHLTLPTIYSV